MIKGSIEWEREMSGFDPTQYSPETIAVRAGLHRTQEGEHSEPIFPTSSYVFNSAAHAAARFSGDEPGNIYSRFTNPTVRTFEERLAALEMGERCVATSSGMAAILSTCLGVLKAGDHIVSSRAIFGSTVILFNNIIAKFGIAISYVDSTDLNAWREAMKPNTRLLFTETPSNPLMEIVDIAAVASIAHEHDALFAVDNCFCTPILQQPLLLGADIVIHSATKYIDGQGRCMGGAIVGSEKIVGGDIFAVVRSGGPCMSPFNAWVFLKGLETLRIRMQAHCDSAATFAKWLTEQTAIERVYYPGLSDHPGNDIAAKQQKLSGGIVAFKVSGGKEKAWRIIDNTRMISITANLGDAKTTITHPATTTHGRLTPELRAEAGISDGLIRVAVGLESIDDIINDISRGL